jgi:hypothetical protein
MVRRPRPEYARADHDDLEHSRILPQQPRTTNHLPTSITIPD